ncbi:hypothetical protein M1M30_gp179 [Maribacter phage Colly_1]|uniref:Uncharacterized protein n=1 Tax=Maribacter phage Colly_1 TaxID=2745691 RepID=A0A8E4UXY0_9CAUD|nr:hypothetical protein M1M30_gp179 [Maribacter phage Colly_1]QQO97283.1 hypothetical protein Colly1_179 [Maribacter phage Colly_1]
MKKENIKTLIESSLPASEIVSSLTESVEANLMEVINTLGLKPGKKVHSNAKTDYYGKLGKGIVILGDFGGFLSGAFYLGDVYKTRGEAMLGSEGMADLIFSDSGNGKWRVTTFGPMSRTVMQNNMLMSTSELTKLSQIIKLKGTALSKANKPDVSKFKKVNISI